MLVNGKPCDHVSIEDRGLLYGDGLFETILCESGEPVLFEQHMQRLRLGCEKLNIELQDSRLIRSEINSVAKNQDCIIKVIVTRGVRARGYQYDPDDNNFTRIVYQCDLPKISPNHYQQGINLFLCQHRLPENKRIAGIKHLNRLDQVIARSEWREEYQEGLTLSNHDNVIEGTMSNIFIEVDGRWITPRLDRCGVRGVLRDFIIEHAESFSTTCEETDIALSQLEQSDAMFVCNSVIGVWPIAQFQKKEFALSEQTIRLMQYLHSNVSSLYVAAR